MNVVVLSSKQERLLLIAAKFEQAAVEHRLQTVHATLREISAHMRDIGAADVLIVDQDAFRLDDLTVIEGILAGAMHLQCALVTSHPSTELLLGAMRAGIRNVISWPPDSLELDRFLGSIASKKKQNQKRQVCVVAMMAPKGGSGTTSVAVNLAYTVAAHRDLKTLLIDLDQYFADAALFASENHPVSTLAELCAQIDRLDLALLNACVMHVHPKLDLLAGAGNPIRATEIRPAHMERLLRLARELYDVIVIDLGQSVNPLSISVLDESDMILTIMVQSISSLNASRRLLDIFKELGYSKEKVSVVLNKYDGQAAMDRKKLQLALDAPIAYVLPLDIQSARNALMHGQPAVRLSPNSKLSRGVDAIADIFGSVAASPRKNSLRNFLLRGRKLALRDKVT